MSLITEGVLTYTVLSGEAVVTRGVATSSPRTERVSAGTTVDIVAGDSLFEPPGMAHTARNKGKIAIVIYLSTLFEAGAPASSPSTATAVR